VKIKAAKMEFSSLIIERDDTNRKIERGYRMARFILILTASEHSTEY